MERFLEAFTGAGRSVERGMSERADTVRAPPPMAGADGGLSGRQAMNRQQDGEAHLALARGQDALPLHLSMEEAEITARASVRRLAWLREELDQLPQWHPLWHEYDQQRRVLEHHLDGHLAPL